MRTAAFATGRVTTTNIALPPPPVSLSQDREWCVVEIDGGWQKIRFHDYDEIYGIPGLYETLFYDVLQCQSPRKVRKMLEGALVEAQAAPENLRVLDLGAGNGMVGEELADLGVEHMVGVDIIEAAAAAAQRDRDGLYDDYFVVDMTDIPPDARRRMEAFEPNCLTSVAALGFGDIPPAAFANAFNLVTRKGWIAFNIKTRFIEDAQAGGFAGMIRRMIDEEVLTVLGRDNYEHRLSTAGEPLHYTAIVGVKNADVPSDWV